MAEPISRADVAHVAKLARLDLTDDELEMFTGQLAAVLDHAADMEALDTAGVPPTAHPLPIENVFRPDEPIPSLPPDAALQNAPNRVGDYFGVPAVFENDQ